MALRWTFNDKRAPSLTHHKEDTENTALPGKLPSSVLRSLEESKKHLEQAVNSIEMSLSRSSLVLPDLKLSINSGTQTSPVEPLLSQSIDQKRQSNIETLSPSLSHPPRAIGSEPFSPLAFSAAKSNPFEKILPAETSPPATRHIDKAESQPSVESTIYAEHPRPIELASNTPLPRPAESELLPIEPRISVFEAKTSPSESESHVFESKPVEQDDLRVADHLPPQASSIIPSQDKPTELSFIESSEIHEAPSLKAQATPLSAVSPILSPDLTVHSLQQIVPPPTLDDSQMILQELGASTSSSNGWSNPSLENAIFPKSESIQETQNKRSPMVFSWSAPSLAKDNPIQQDDSVSVVLSDPVKSDVGVEFQPRKVNNSILVQSYQQMVPIQRSSILKAVQFIIRHLIFSNQQKMEIDYHDIYQDGLLYGSLADLSSTSQHPSKSSGNNLHEALHPTLKQVFTLDYTLFIELCRELEMDFSVAIDTSDDMKLHIW